MITKRFPLVIDFDNGNTIIELPEGDCLNLQNSDICDVRNITVTGGTITIDGQPLSTFTGLYADLVNKPFIPTTLTDLGIAVGANNEVLTSKGDGTFVFQPPLIDYNNLVGLPDIPETLLDLGIVDGVAGSTLTTDGNGTFYFQNLSDTLLQNFEFIESVITTKVGSSSDDIIVMPRSAGIVKIDSNGIFVLPVGPTNLRNSDHLGAVRFNTDTYQFEGHYGSETWASLGGVRSTDNKTYILAEASPGLGDNELTFYTNEIKRLTISETEAIFDPSLDVTIEDAFISNLTLTGGLSLEGDITLGDEAADTLFLNSRISGNLIPKEDGRLDIGQAGLRWKDLYLEGQAYINDYRLPVIDGNVGEVLETNGQGDLSFTHKDFYGGNRVYVSSKYGDDNNDGTHLPVKTIRRASEIASQLAYTSNVVDTQKYTEIRKFEYSDILNSSLDFTVTTYPSFTFELELFRQDIKDILNAIKYDVALGTNYNQIELGIRFAERNKKFVMNLVPAQTDAFNHIRTELDKGIDASLASTYKAVVDEIQDITINGVGVANAIVHSTSPHTTVGSIALSRFETIKQFVNFEIEAYLQTTNPTVIYVRTDLRTTIDRYLDALYHDLVYGGNSATNRKLLLHLEEIDNIVGDTNRAAVADAYEHINLVLRDLLQGTEIVADLGNGIPQSLGTFDVSHSEAAQIKGYFWDAANYIRNQKLPVTTYPQLQHLPKELLDNYNKLADSYNDYTNIIAQMIADSQVIVNPVDYKKDIQYIVDSVLFDLKFGGNQKTIKVADYFRNQIVAGRNQTELLDTITYIRTVTSNTFTGANQTSVNGNLDSITNHITTGNVIAPTDGSFVTKRVGIVVATGDYVEDNPIVLADDVSVISEKGVIIRPANQHQDIFRVRNNNNIFNIEFRDHIDANNNPDFTFRYAVAIDNVDDINIDRRLYSYIPYTKPTMYSPIAVKNTSVTSLLGGNGIEIDGSLVNVLPTVPTLEDGMPERGYAAILQDVTVTSFAGIGVRSVKDARLLANNVTTMFCQTGLLTQSGGYIGANSCTSSYGLTAIASTGRTSELLASDIGYVTEYGTYNGIQTLGCNNLQRPLNNHYTILWEDQAGLDVTNEYDNNVLESTTATFTADNTNVVGNFITLLAAHSFTTGDAVVYDSNGNPDILGLNSESVYYVQDGGPTSVSLFYDAALTQPVNNMITDYTSGNHSFTAKFEYAYVDSILESHNDYQDLTVDNSFTYDIIIGNTIYGLNAGDQVRATIAQWDPASFLLTVAIEENNSGNKIKFDNTSTIEEGVVAAAVSVPVTNTVDREDLYSAEFTVKTSRNNLLRAQANTIAKTIKFYRPSTVNAVNHNWNYVGSGVDYNALPQHGGIIDSSQEAISAIPGRVYVQGTTEAGDYRVGELLEAFPKEDRIEFNSKLAIAGLTSLAFDFGNSSTVSTISTDTGLGENEEGGPNDERLITQKSVHTYIQDNLSNVINKEVSETAKSGALPLLNRRGQLDPSLLTPKTTHSAFLVEGYRNRFNIHHEVPVKNLIPGDIVIEEYYESVINTSVPVTVSRGEIITQANTGASGVVKDDVVNGYRIKLLEPLNHTWSEDVIADNLTSDVQGLLVDPGSVSGVHVTEAYGPSQRRDNYFINTAIGSQYLVIEESGTPAFTNTVALGNTVTGAASGAKGTAKEYREGALTQTDPATLPSGIGYLDGVYKKVELALVSGTGYGALADIVVSGGAITQVDVVRTGSGYNNTSILSPVDNPANVTISDAIHIPRGGGSPASIGVFEIENRLYVDVDQVNGLPFNASLTNFDYIEDDIIIDINLPDLGAVDEVDFFGYPYDPAATPAAGVDTENNLIWWNTAHTFENGDYVKYDSNGFPEIGGLTTGQTYYVKVNNSLSIELYYTYGLHTIERVILTKTEYGNHKLIRQTVNPDTNQIRFEDHPFTTGQPVKIIGAVLPNGIASGEYFFIGSVTKNTFSLHKGYDTAAASIDGKIFVPHDLLTTGGGGATFTLQPAVIVEAVNTSGEFESSWTSLWKTEIDGDEIVSGIIDPARLGKYDPTEFTFLRGDNEWHTAVQGVYTETLHGITFDGPYETDGSGNEVFHGDVKITVDYAGYSDPAVPSLGTETPGIASFNFDEFVVTTTNGNVRIKKPAEGGEVDAKYLNGKEETYYTNPENLTRNVPVERGGTNLNSFLAGDILYAATDIGDGTFTESLTALPIAPDNSVLIVNGGLPSWQNNLVVDGLLVRNIQIGITDFNTIDTIAGDLILDSFTGETHINDNVTVPENVTIGGNVDITGNTTQTGHATISEIQIGVSFANEIDTVSTDLILDSQTGETHIDDNLTVTGNALINQDLTVDMYATIKQDLTVNSDVQIDETLGVTQNATINQIQIGLSQDNEIDTLTGDLVLDSFTGLTLINDNLQVTGTTQLDGQLTATGDVLINGTQTLNGNLDVNGTQTITGDLLVQGNATFEEIQVGVSNSNEIDTVSTDLVLDSFTGNVIVDDTLTVQDVFTVNANTVLSGDTQITGNETFIGNKTQTGNETVTGAVTVTGEATIDEIQIGKVLDNEIDTVSTDLILDSFTGETIVDDNLTVTGDLTVQGVMTSIATTNVEITDVNILLAKGSGNATNANGAGLTVDIGSSAPTIATPTILYNALTDEWDLNKNINIAANDFITTGSVNTADLTATNDITVTNNLNIGNNIVSTGGGSFDGALHTVLGYTTDHTITAAGVVTSNTGFTTPGYVYADGTITSVGGFIGNADSASQWQTPRTVFFQDSTAGAVSDVTGQFTIDGSGDVTEVVLSYNQETFEDMMANLIVTNSTHIGVDIIYDDAANSLSFNMQSNFLYDTIGSMFTTNTERGVITTYDAVNSKINITLDDNEFADIAGTLFLDNTGNFGVTTVYDDATNNVVFDLIYDDVKDVAGEMVALGVQNGITVTYDNLNKVYDFDVHDPVISISGDAVGSATMTNLGDVDIAVTMVSNAVTLGINTTGDYVESLVAGDGIRIINQTGPTSTPTILHGETSSVVSTTNTVGATHAELLINIGVDTFGHVNFLETANIALFYDHGWDVHVDGVAVDNIVEQDLVNFAGGVNTTLGYDAGTHTLTINSLDTIYEGWNLYVDGNNKGLIVTQENVDFIGGNNVVLTYAGTNNAITIASDYNDTDTRLTGISWNNATGDLTLTREQYTDASGTTAVAAQADFVVNLDNRYIKLGEEIDTLAAVTARGATTTANITTGTINSGAITSTDTITGVDSLTLSGTGRVILPGGELQGTTSAMTLKYGTSGITIGTNSVLPLAHNTHNLGSSATRWNTVYATTFNGTATMAQYADLAEMYTADKEYEPGTVVMFGGEAEVTASDKYATTRVAGVISTAPAYLMNAGLENGVAVALKGRVPCKVIGTVQKGDMIVASTSVGVAVAVDEYIGGAIIGKAVESSYDRGIKMIEVAVGVN
jgi:hypothetical protein